MKNFLSVRKIEIQSGRLASILQDIAQVFLASVLIDPIVHGGFTFSVFVIGVSVTSASWFFVLTLK